jgi:hypothetical protein
MKAPSVREGSKENGTAAKISPVSITPRRWGTDTLESHPVTERDVLGDSCRSAAQFYKDCVKLIRILRVGVIISLINSIERIFVVGEL